MSAVFRTVLVANRGEIAVRVFRTLRGLGIRSVAVYSDADAGARHVREADVAVRIGPAPARESYLSAERILAAAVQTGADAIHPGYGFLSEKAEFATACAGAGMVFVGPSPAAMTLMGDKIRARATVAAAGVPVLPGRAEPGMTDDDLVAAAAEIGFPVLVKPSAGGGGMGMHAVHDAGDLPAALRSARRTALAAFGDETLFLERLVSTPRHIEVQVLADHHGTTLHLGERECSLQRRHQKVVEEAPSVLLDDTTRGRITAAAVATARTVDYSGAGTVEFLMSAERPDEFFFMEMNTRLQVEHPVTELVTGVDLVEQQLLVAAGLPLALTQESIVVRGHAVEARVYAEDPASGFLPTGGPVLLLREPQGPGLRVDSGLREGTDVGTAYDPMLAKVVAWAPERADALARLHHALGGTTILGTDTNLGFLRRLVAHPDVVAGRIDTGLIERELPRLVAGDPPDEVLTIAAVIRLWALWPSDAGAGLWDLPTGWRVGTPAPLRFRFAAASAGVTDVTVTGTPAAALVSVGDGPVVPAAVSPGPDGLLVTVAGRTRTVLHDRHGATTWLALDGDTWAIRDAPEERRRARGEGTAASADIRSPMPGSVVSVLVDVGAAVAAGQGLVVVEAMKMEHVLTATTAGVAEILVAVGDRVGRDDVVARVTAEGEVTA